MEQKLRELLLQLGYTYYKWEGHDEEGNYKVTLTHSIKYGPSRWEKSCKIQEKTRKALEKAGLQIVHCNTNEERYKGMGGTMTRLYDDVERHFNIDVPRNKGYFSEITCYIALKTCLA